MSSRPSGLAVELRARVPRAMVSELSRQVRRAMRAAGLDGAAVALSLTGDAELHALNLAFAGEDHATDVLSFAQREGEGARAPSGPLGDVVISVETARRQAREGGRTLLAELVHLAVHGLAHLQGYDHASSEEERVMFGYEAKLRAQAIGRGAVRRVRRPPRAVNARSRERVRAQRAPVA